MDRATAYLKRREADYTKRKPRYAHTAQILAAEGLNDTHTLVDVAAGWTELDYCLRADLGWKGRYIPVDMAIDGTDVEHWVPHLDAEWFVALEILEHLTNPERLVRHLQARALKGVVISTPNPAVVDVFVMDETHLTAVHQTDLERWGFTVTACDLYGVRSEDGLVGYWRRSGRQGHG